MNLHEFLGLDKKDLPIIESCGTGSYILIKYQFSVGRITRGAAVVRTSDGDTLVGVIRGHGPGGKTVKADYIGRRISEIMDRHRSLASKKKAGRMGPFEFTNELKAMSLEINGLFI